jgi:hypothetical protein
MNAMPKASTYKRVGASSANKLATLGSPTRTGKMAASTKASPARRQQRRLADMQVQIRQINATLDEIEQSMRERQAW